MTRVELIKERQRDKKDISAFIDHFFEDNPLGITFKALEELTLNYSGELFFIVLNCLYESIPFCRNFLRARTNHVSLVSDGPKQTNFEIAYLSLRKSKAKYEQTIP